MSILGQKETKILKKPPNLYIIYNSDMGKQIKGEKNKIFNFQRQLLSK